MPNIKRKTPFRKRDGSTMMICKQSPSYFPFLPEAHRPAESKPSASRMTMSFKGIKVNKSNAAPVANNGFPDCMDTHRRIIRYIRSIAPFVLFNSPSDMYSTLYPCHPIHKNRKVLQLRHRENAAAVKARQVR